MSRLVKESGLTWSDPAPFASQSLADALLAPTRIYVKSILHALRDGAAIKGLAHITGGGITENIPRVLPETLCAEIDLSNWALPPLFKWLQATAHIDDAEMLKTFNCGIGMAVIVAADQADSVTALLQQAGEQVISLGTLRDRSDAANAVHYTQSWQ